MTEKSWLWTTGGSVPTITQSNWRVIAGILAACSGYEGVSPGFLNECAGTVTGANTVAINTGGAVVDGRIYQNDASTNVNIPSAVGGGNTRIDRIVLRADWGASPPDVTITRVAGSDAASPSVPSITQTSETTYDIKLYQALVDTSGTVTLTDERDWAIANNSRTRSFLVQCQGIYNQTDATYYDQLSALGPAMVDAKYTVGYGQFYVPDEYGENMTITPIVRCSASGDGYFRHYVRYGAITESYDNHVDNTSFAAETLSGSNANEQLTTTTTSSIATGDYVSLQLERDGTHASDTLSATVYCVGWLVSYEVNP